MLFIYALLMGFSIAFLVLHVLRRILKPVSKNKKKFVLESEKAGRTLNEYNWKETRDNLLKRIKTVNLSDEFRDDLNKDLNRLGIEHTAEDIRKMQILYTGAFLLLVIFLFMISALLGVIGFACVILVWNLPVNMIKTQIKERNDEFLIRLDELYTVIYNQYKRKNDEHLGKIISAYIPTASNIMRKELMLVMRDIESGEDYALKQLRSRIPHPLILRFCDMIGNNLEGVDNVDVMENFYLELKQARDLRRRKRNEIRAKKIDTVNKVLYAPFIFLVVVYLIVSTISNF